MGEDTHQFQTASHFSLHSFGGSFQARVAMTSRYSASTTVKPTLRAIVRRPKRLQFLVKPLLTRVIKRSEGAIGRTIVVPEEVDNVARRKRIVEGVEPFGQLEI